MAVATVLAAGEAPAPAEEKLVADGPALLRDWVPPVYPAEALKAKRSGIVHVRLIVDEHGKVAQARALEDSDEEFIEPALAAVRAWGFAPGLESGKEVVCCLETDVIFSPAMGQQKPSVVPPESQQFALAPREAPKPVSTPVAQSPEVLVERRFSGVAVFRCVVLRDGRVVAPQIKAASHADLVLPALEAVAHWEFTPGKQGDLAVDSEVEGQVTFDTFNPTPEEVLAANGITGPDGAAPSHRPTPVVMTDPVWPIDLLLAGEGGAATVAFTVTESGGVRDVRVKEATHPEFGHALAAALETWGFTRPYEPGRRVTVAMEKRTEFKAVPLDPSAADAFTMLVRALRANEVGGAKGLDERLTPVYRVAPAYPSALRDQGSPAGRAEIEFVVARDGRARLPRVLKATHQEFGWAAATAVAQWVFRTPRRGGEPVDVKVRIPIDFAAPAAE